jgi:DNA repair protein RadA
LAKSRTVFVCQHCGFDTPKWLGKCPSCNSWNTIVEEYILKENKQHTLWQESSVQKAMKLTEVTQSAYQRINTPDHELNRVLGGGIVEGAVILVAGEPGIGKSTLFLQVCLQMTDHKTLYISGEESIQQIKMRADRLHMNHENFYLLSTTDLHVLLNEIKNVQPDIVVVDSIQTLATNNMDSAPGSVSQVRECTTELVRFAKTTGAPVFIIGHITKEGVIAGPKVLEHMVDTVLQFEGDRHYAYRIIRTIKNRFGSAHELGIYEMNELGLRQISNPSEILITQKDEPLNGVAIAATMEGARPLLIEVQALVTQAVYGTPQRTVSGYDLRRLQLLLAVLEKRGGFHFGVKDVFLNIAGGIKVEDPAVELAIICALLSSYEDKPIPMNICFIGEIGLSGEVRAVSRVEQRIAEAEKLGFEKLFLSKFNQQLKKNQAGISVHELSNIEEIYRFLFG